MRRDGTKFLTIRVSGNAHTGQGCAADGAPDAARDRARGQEPAPTPPPPLAGGSLTAADARRSASLCPIPPPAVLWSTSPSAPPRRAGAAGGPIGRRPSSHVGGAGPILRGDGPRVGTKYVRRSARRLDVLHVRPVGGLQYDENDGCKGGTAPPPGVLPPQGPEAARGRAVQLRRPGLRLRPVPRRSMQWPGAGASA